MNNRYQKTILLSILTAMIIISGCGANGKVNAPEVEELMVEELPNGQSKVVNPIPIEQEMLEWLNNKQTELQLLIAEQTELESNDVLIVLGPMPDGEHSGGYDIACSVVLETASTFEDEIMNKVVEDIIGAITHDSADVKISKENITIVNNNGIKLN